MAKVKLTACDNCEAVIQAGEAAWRIRGVDKVHRKVATVDYCGKCAGELFDDDIKDLREAKPRPAKTAAPAKATPAKMAQPKAS